MSKSEGSYDKCHSNDIPWMLRVVSDLNQPKSVKEAVLGRIRQIEKETGRVIYGHYNRKE